MVGVIVECRRRLELLHDVLERVRDADDDGVQPTGRYRRLQSECSSRKSRKQLRSGLARRARRSAALRGRGVHIDVEDELIGRRDPASPGRNYYRERRRNEPRRPRVLVDGESHRPHPDDGQLHVLGLHVQQRARDSGHRENTLFASLSYEHPRGWFVAADALSVDEQFGDNANSAAGFVDGYTLANLRAGYEGDVGRMTLSPFVGINNVFDEDYTANVRLNPLAWARPRAAISSRAPRVTSTPASRSTGSSARRAERVVVREVAAETRELGAPIVVDPPLIRGRDQLARSAALAAPHHRACARRPRRALGVELAGRSSSCTRTSTAR